MSEILTAEHGKEGGHFYRQDGTPAYTYINKKGEEKPTTLREARKETPHLVPGVTLITACAYRGGLENWKIDQAILSALTLPRIDDEPEVAYLSRIKSDAKEQAKKAAERGTLIHAWVQQGFEHKPIPHEGLIFFSSSAQTLDAECGPTDWICEKSFAKDRFGGKCDLHSDKYLVDIKTSDKDLTTVKSWPEHFMQLAAYDAGLGNGHKCGILYINVNTAESRLIWLTPKELNKGWNCFHALLNYWYADKDLEAI